MRRWVRALPVILVALLAVIVSGSGKAPAAPVGSSGAAAGVLQVTPVGRSTTSAGGPGVVVGLDPGTSAVQSFEVANRSAGLVLTVRLAAVNATRATSGAVRYASSAAPGTPATWLTLSDVVATLEPQSKLRVTVTVAPPVNAAPGEVFAGVVARVDHAVRASDQAAISEHLSATLPIAIQLKGTPTALVSIVGARLVRDHGGESLEITFLNAGATPNTMVGHVDVRGSAPRSAAIHASVAPLTHTTVRVPFALPSGAKTAAISVVAADGGGDQATWSGSVGLAAAPVAHSGSSVARPSAVHRITTTLAAHGATLPRLALLLVVLAFAAAALWLAAELRRNRAARHVSKVAATGSVAAPALIGATAPAAPTAPSAPGVFYAGADEPMGAVAVQLGALVDAIDRLATRLGAGPEPEPAADVHEGAASAGGTEPAAADGAPEMAETGALLLARPPRRGCRNLPPTTSTTGRPKRNSNSSRRARVAGADE